MTLAWRAILCTRGNPLRAAFFAEYTETNREYIPLDAAQTLVDGGRPLVSANFVVPYPPGFPILVPRPDRLDRHPRLPATGRRQGNPRLPTRTGPVRVHRNRPRSPRAPPWKPGRHPRHRRRSGRPGAGARSTADTVTPAAGQISYTALRPTPGWKRSRGSASRAASSASCFAAVEEIGSGFSPDASRTRATPD